MIKFQAITPMTMEKVIPLAVAHADEFNEFIDPEHLTWFYQQKMFHSPGDNYDFLILQDKKIVGYASGSVAIEGHRDMKMFMLQYIFIHEEHRVGKVLLRLADHMCMWMKKRNVERIYLATLHETDSLDGLAELINRNMSFSSRKVHQIILER